MSLSWSTHLSQMLSLSLYHLVSVSPGLWSLTTGLRCARVGATCPTDHCQHYVITGATSSQCFAHSFLVQHQPPPASRSQHACVTLTHRHLISKYRTPGHDGDGTDCVLPPGNHVTLIITRCSGCALWPWHRKVIAKFREKLSNIFSNNFHWTEAPGWHGGWENGCRECKDEYKVRTWVSQIKDIHEA